MDVGDDNAAYSYAIMLYQGHRGTPRDADAGREILTRLAHKGHPYAQKMLATMMVQEGGDIAIAVQLYELAAKAGLDDGWTTIGRMYRAGLGVKQDHVKAIEYFRKGAQAGNAQSNYMLGVYYSSGMGLPDKQSNHELAFKYFQSAAIRGLPEAQYNLGMCYLQGHGVAQSPAHAAQYLGMAALQGFQLAEANLARMYEEGRGVKKDLERAKELYRAAARKSGKVGEDAVRRLKDLEEEDGGKCVIM
ncbi:hypothetical protein BC937DRAFT_87342 [Endogone sp. FLAS-F59071]|nr:hypothetical protein BC937DRAFT_87342 [Endogone sp. FLAS-F59071]|eukprot:RUS23331.1 hypothetical protein BC937DRAFT_87342 [Endogone sp. FLAS-F59071]